MCFEEDEREEEEAWTGRTAQTNKSIAITTVDVPIHTSSTRSVEDNGLHTHSIADFVRGHSFTYFYYRSTELVTKRQWDLFTRDWVRMS